LISPAAAFLHDVVAMCCSGGDTLAGGGEMHLVKLPLAALDTKAPLGGHRDSHGWRQGSEQARYGPRGGEPVITSDTSSQMVVHAASLGVFLAGAVAVQLTTGWIARNRRQRYNAGGTIAGTAAGVGAGAGGLGDGGGDVDKREGLNHGDEDDWGGRYARQESEAKARTVRATALLMLERALGDGDDVGTARGTQYEDVGDDVTVHDDLPGGGGGKGFVGLGRTTGDGSPACTICLASMQVLSPGQVRWLPCAHAFHRHCVTKWLELKQTCPLCLSPVKAANVLSLKRRARR